MIILATNGKMDKILGVHLQPMIWNKYSVSWIKFSHASLMWRWSYRKHCRLQISHINWNHCLQRQFMSFHFNNWTRRLRLRSLKKVTHFIPFLPKNLSLQPILNFIDTCLMSPHIIKWRALKIVWILTLRSGTVSAKRSHIKWLRESTLHYQWLARSATKKILWWIFDIMAYST